MTSIRRISTAATVILSLAAAGGPTATARQTDTNSAAAADQATTTVYSRPDKSVIRVTTPNGRDVYSRPDKSVIVASTSDGARRARTAAARQAVVQIQTPASGFDWGDAGIGAAGGLALAMLGLGGALTVSQRRPRRNRQTTTLS